MVDCSFASRSCTSDNGIPYWTAVVVRRVGRPRPLTRTRRRRHAGQVLAVPRAPSHALGACHPRADGLRVTGARTARRRRTAGLQLHARSLREEGVHDPDAGRREVVHHRVRAEGYSSVVSVHAPPHAVRHPAVPHRGLQACARAVAGVRSRRLHLRLSGRARKISLRRHVPRHEPVQAREREPEGRRREQRQLRHDRLAAQEHPAQQRPSGPVGNFVPGVADGDGDDWRPSRSQGGVTAVIAVGYVHRRRLSSQRRVPLHVHVRLAVGQRAATRRTDDRPWHAIQLRDQRRIQLLSESRDGCPRERVVLPRPDPHVERLPRSIRTTTGTGKSRTRSRI